MGARFKLKATILDKKGRVLATGFNSYQKTHPLQYQYAQKADKPDAVFLHAEMDAIVKHIRNPLGTPHTICVERYTKKGKPALAKPCRICQLAIEHLLGISDIRWTK